MKSKLLGVLCFVVLCIILFLGLSPFHPPKNDLRWLKSTNGLAFGKYGTVLGSAPSRQENQPAEQGTSVEIWLQPERWMGATFLSFYRPEKDLLLTLNQSLTDLELSADLPDNQHFYIGDAFAPALQRKKSVLVSVTFGAGGTKVYIDGAPRADVPRFVIPTDTFNGQLILGDSPRQPNSFRGQIRGLAIYEGELDGSQILRHYRDWTTQGRPDTSQDDRVIGLYLFDEHAGDTIHNRAMAGGELSIPPTYRVIDKIALEPFWREFDFSGSYWSGNLKNIVGFMPLGFCFYSFLVIAWPLQRALAVTIALGFLVSLTIEVLQAFLPTRDSGTTDLITNTIGTYVGVLCYTKIYPLVVDRFPWLDWF